MIKFCIYKITNLVTNKIYIGQSNNFERRLADYKHAVKKNNPKQLIIKSLIKHGLENFLFEIIYCAIDREEANIKEIFFIEAYNSLIPNGYNIEKGGKYAPLSQEVLNKISKALKGRPSRNKGIPCSEDQKQKKQVKLWLEENILQKELRMLRMP